MAGPYLIIGGTKFIGPFVVRRLAALGNEVAVYHRGESEADLPAAVRHVRRPEAGMPVRSFPDELFQPPPETVIHMIPMGEEDARAALAAFSGHARHMVWLSSGDVYRAYGRFMGIEADPVDNALLNEDSPLRTVLYPYRAQAKSPDDVMYSYDKTLVERVALSDPKLPGTVLRLPKVYGPGSNADLATIYQARDHPVWRWTHGYVENVAAAIVLAATNPLPAGRIYNVGEERTPTIAERLARLPASPIPALPAGKYNFEQDIAYDTSRIRRELGYSEPIPEEEGIRRTLAGT
jgi:nucleoside-diphosphate-sugar epimerase